MKIILLKDVRKLGQVGACCEVKTGYAKNYLVPNRYALIATKDNIKAVNEDIARLEKESKENIAIAGTVKEVIDGRTFHFVSLASDSGILYGALKTKDIANIVNSYLSQNDINFKIKSSLISTQGVIKSIGVHKIAIELSQGIECSVILNVCRSEGEISSSSSMDKKNELPVA